MIARNEPKNPIWAEIAAPLPGNAVQWRQQGRPKQRDGKWFAPFVAYIDAQFVRDRLDDVIPGEWDLTLELLPPLVANGDGEALDEPIAFKARLQILGVIREDVGAGKDYKTASTDAFKRAAVRFGIGHELYTDYEILWVQVDSDSKFAKPVEDPQDVWVRKQNRGASGNGHAAPSPSPTSSPRSTSKPSPTSQATPSAAVATDGEDDASCPKCGGRMFDNRVGKKNPKAPDFRCRTRSCDGVIWPPKGGKQAAPVRADEPELPEDPFADERDLPF